MYTAVLTFTTCLLFCLSKVVADCVSYGYDYVDGGSYFVNTNDPNYFSFGTDFFGCEPSDSQGNVIPILVGPDETEYYCSGIATSPDGADQVSYCNVTGNELPKSQMLSGDWICVIEGLTFAWMRTFNIVAGPQATVTLTPTAFFNFTVTPSTTINTTSTSEYDTTLPPSTTTVPSTTITRTITTTPPKVTVTSTSTTTRTRITRTPTTTWISTTLTTSCSTQSSRKDPTCTIHPTKALLLSSSISSNPSSVSTSSGQKRRVRDAPALPRDGRWLPHGAIGKRDLDQPTTTVVETTFISSVYTTFTAPTSTEIDIYYTTVTSTFTPAPVTAYAGKAHTTITTTAPTPTRTIILRTTITVWSTSTVWATLTSTTKVPPSGVVCKPTV